MDKQKLLSLLDDESERFSLVDLLCFLANKEPKAQEQLPKEIPSSCDEADWYKSELSLPLPKGTVMFVPIGMKVPKRGDWLCSEWEGFYRCRHNNSKAQRNVFKRITIV